MKSGNTPYVPEIDHLRLLAAMLVFAFHALHMFAVQWKPWDGFFLAGAIAEGHTGVSLFFVLSGFIFMKIALGSATIDYGQFLRNRLLRIAPLFLVVFVIAVSVGRDRFAATDMLYLLITNLGQAPTSWHFLTGPAWSISVEFGFYLVFPFLARFVHDQGLAFLVRLVGLLFVVKVAAYLASDNPTLMLYSTLVGRFDQFLIGMAAAIVYANATLSPAAGRALLGAAAIAIWLGVSAQARYASFFLAEKAQPFWIMWGTIEALGWAVFIVAYLAARLPWPKAIDHALRRGGEWSFSLYMWHTMVIFIVWKLAASFGLPAPVAATIALVGTLAFAWLSYTTIERPFLRLRTTYVTPKAASESAGDAAQT